MNSSELANAELIPRLPCLWGPERNEEIPSELAGAQIISIGTVDKETANRAGLEGGGLVIDYKSPKHKRIRRMVLSSNELATWVVYMGPRGSTIRA